MRLFSLLILVFVLSPAVAGVQVTDGRIVENSSGTQVIFNLSAPVKYSSFLLDDPPRFVVDLSDAQIKKARQPLPLHSADVTGVRAGPRNGSLRLVLDLTTLWRGEVSSTPTSEGGGQQLIVSILRNQQPDNREIGLGAAVRDATDRAPSLAASTPPRKSSRTTYHKVATRKDVVIAIDPGHGGKDSGAIGPGKTQEKDVVLQIGRQLKALIDKQPGMRAVLTRNGDHYLHLYQRIKIARQHDADVFVSIHADAYNGSSASGSSVFMLSTKGASSAAARWLAQKENEADLIGGNFSSVDDNLKPVVFDIYHDAVLADSMLLADQVLGRLERVGSLHSGHVERAGFAVLKGPDMPSILVETAFISNPEEERKLRSHQHQQKLAQAIFDGIRTFLKKKPPLETYLMVADTEEPELIAPSAPEPTPAVAAKPVVVAKPIAEATPIAKTKPVPAVRKPLVAATAPAPAPQPVMLPAVHLISKSTRPAPLPAVHLVGRSTAPTVRHHTIQRGESLVDIAQHYRVNLSRLRSVNGLRENQLRMPVGTTLTIPLDS
ncbi:MAG: N-acetylmuramoyl-L-alanine amidase [Gammaproteobacteria bacterium]|nr:N-acetylmuramoyl-L-alanine amidase [Gammaproteobacteria bacterium]MCP5459125.1 N-acetylmuramoyl-L-alanine amidase [Gammaproteobacteria bacterium]